MTPTETSKQKKRLLHGSKGLTLDEIRMRQMVNSMKIRIERQRLITTLLPGTPSGDASMTNNLNRIESFMQYAKLAITTFRIVKKTVRFFNSLRK